MSIRRLRHPATLLIAGFTLLGVVVLGALVLTEAQRRTDAWVRHSMQVQTTLWQLRANVQAAETGQRGYLVSGVESYLNSYQAALSDMEPLMGRLTSQVADNPRQTASAARLHGLIQQRLRILALGVALRHDKGFEAARDYLLVNRGDALTEEIRRQVAGMIAEEARLLDVRQDRAAATRTALQASLVLGFLGLLALTLTAVRAANGQLRALQESRDELSSANDRLTAEAVAREKAESQVRQMQKMEAVGQLTGGIAHDFNNMLSVIIGSLEIAKRRLRGEPDRAEARIDNAMDGAQRAASLTARLLIFSRQAPLEPRPLEPTKLISGMSDLLRRTIGEQMNIEVVLGGGTWPVHADPQLLENAILNLCVNARDAMPDGGRLTIETSNTSLDEAYAQGNLEVVPGQYVLISVTDTGTGMAPEIVDRVFEPFFTTKEVGRGTGLGLSQVFGFVKQSGGHIKIYSEVGVGTSVKLYLPRYLGEATAAAPFTPRPVSPRARPGETILLVEDDENVRKTTGEALQDLGYGVVLAATGEDAIARFDGASRIDLLMTDIVMPGMTGRVLADRLRSDHPNLHVLYMTGYTRNAVVHNGVLDFGVAFLQKPFTLEQLSRKVRDVLDGGGVNRPAP